jgi:methionyl-tRNA synthetase
LNATDLINPKSTITGETPVNEIDETLVLPLNREDFLKRILVGHKMTGNPMFTDK